jgi:hypothetical protein
MPSKLLGTLAEVGDAGMARGRRTVAGAGKSLNEPREISKDRDCRAPNRYQDLHSNRLAASRFVPDRLPLVSRPSGLVGLLACLGPEGGY